MNISTFTIGGLDVDMTFNKNAIAYTFEQDGKHYGYKIDLPSKKVMDIVAATVLLLTNALETKAAVDALPHDH